MKENDLQRLQIRLFGTPEIWLDDAQVTFDTRKAIALLAYLAVSNQTHQRSTIAALLWPESDEARGRSALRRTLAAVNKGLGKTWIEATRTTIGISAELPPSALFIDVQQFENLLSSVRHTCETPLSDTCLHQLEEAIDLYRATFMQGFTLVDSAQFDEWQLFQAEHYQQQMGNALLQLAQAHRQRGDWQAAISYARRWLAIDELSESAHRLLMMLYTFAGQRSAALKQYDVCVRILDDELGVEPQPETVALFEQINSGDIAAAPPPATVESKPVQYRVPNVLSSFVGRKRELDEIAARLTQVNCRLLTLTGVGGVGKTRLALATAQRIGSQFENGACFVPLETVNSAERVLPTIAAALSFNFSGTGDPFEQVAQFLRNKQLLLVLDNLEQLLNYAQWLPDLLHNAPGVKILATSQERLNVAGEWLMPVSGMESESAAIQLFLDRASQVMPSYQLTDADRQHIHHICELVDRLPLGIELAASWMQLFPPEEIARRISQNYDFLVTTLRNVPERHRSLRAIFEYSWELLTDELREMLARLAIFQRGCTEAAALAVADADLLMLMQLVNRSLLRRSSWGRFVMPPVVRSYVLDKGSAARDGDGTQPSTEARHARYYAQRTATYAAQLRSPQQAQAAAELRIEIGNLRAAWRWMQMHAAVDQLATYAHSMFLVYEWFSWLDEGLQAFEGDVPVLLAYRGALHVRRADYAEGRALLRNALALVEDERLLAHTHFYLGIAAEALGDLDSAETHQSTSYQMYQQLSDELGMSNTLNALGNIARLQHQAESALHFYRQSLRLSEKLGDQRGIASTLHNLGYTQEALNDFDAARALYYKSIAIKRELDDRRGLAFTLNNMGFLLYRQHEYARAQQVLDECHAVFNEVGYRRGAGYALINLGHVARAQSHEPLAIERYTAARDILQAVGDVRGVEFATAGLQGSNE